MPKLNYPSLRVREGWRRGAAVGADVFGRD